MSGNENLEKAILNLVGGLKSVGESSKKTGASANGLTLQLATALEQSDIIALSSGNTIRKVRTPEGQKKYGQPIGTIIVSDGKGHVLKVLHKGNGNAADSPSVSSYQDSPEAAKYGVAKKGTHTGAGAAPKAKSPSDHITGEKQTYDHSKYGHIAVQVPEGGKVHETGTGFVVEHPDGKMIDYKGKSGAVTVHEFGKKLPKSSTKPAHMAYGVEQGSSASPYPGVATSGATAAPSTIEVVKKTDLPPLPEKPTNGEAAVHAFKQAVEADKPVYMVKPKGESNFHVQAKPGLQSGQTIAVHPTGGMYYLETGGQIKPLKIGGATEGADKAWLAQIEKITGATKAEKPKAELPKPDKSLMYADPEGKNDPIKVSYNDKNDDLYAITGAHAVLALHLSDGTGTLYSKYQTKDLTEAQVHQLQDGTYKNPNWTHPLQINNEPVKDSVLGSGGTPEIDATTSADDLKKLGKAELEAAFNTGKISAKKYKEAAGIKDPAPTTQAEKIDAAVQAGTITHSKGEKLKAAQAPQVESKVGTKIDKGEKKPAAGSVSHVKATKVGENDHGKVWLFTAHSHSSGDAYYAVPTDKGYVVSVNQDGSNHEAGPFPQMKEAKAWVDKNATAKNPELPGTPAKKTPKKSALSSDEKKVIEKLKEAAKKPEPTKPAAPSKPTGGALSHVKATKTGQMEHGKPVWVFTSHKHAGGDLEAHPTADGKYEIHNANTGEIHGPFDQMKAAKAWVDKNGSVNTDSGKGVKKAVAEKKAEVPKTPADIKKPEKPGNLVPNPQHTDPPLADWEKALLDEEAPKPKIVKGFSPSGQKYIGDATDKFYNAESGSVLVQHSDGSGVVFMGEHIQTLTSAQTKLLASASDFHAATLKDNGELDWGTKASDLGSVFKHPDTGADIAVPKLTGKQELYVSPGAYIVKDGDTATVYGSKGEVNEAPWSPFEAVLHTTAAKLHKADPKTGAALPKIEGNVLLNSPEPKPIDVSVQKPDMTKVSPITGTPDNVVEQVTGSVVKSAFAGHFTGKDVKVAKDPATNGYVVKNFGDPATGDKTDLLIGKNADGWLVSADDGNNLTVYAENFKTLADAKQWVSQYGQPDAALVKKATVTKTPYGTDFVWNGKKYHLTPGARAWETSDGKLVIRASGDGTHDFVVHPDGFATAYYQLTSIKALNATAKQLAAAPNLTFGKYTPSPKAGPTTYTESLDAYVKEDYVNVYNFRSKVISAINGDGFFDQPAEKISETLDHINNLVSDKKVSITPKDQQRAKDELEYYGRAFRVKGALAKGEEPNPEDLTFIATKSPKTHLLFGYSTGALTQAAEIPQARDYYVLQQAKADGFDLSTNALESTKALATKMGVTWAAGMDDSSATGWLHAHYLNNPPYAFADYAKAANSKIAIAKVLSDEKYAKDLPAPTALTPKPLQDLVSAHGFQKFVSPTVEEMSSYDPAFAALPDDQKELGAKLAGHNTAAYNAFMGAPINTLSANIIGEQINSMIGDTTAEKIDHFISAYDYPVGSNEAVAKIYAHYEAAGNNEDLTNLLDKLGSSTTATASPGEVAKPDSVTDDVWAYVKLAEKNPEITAGMPEAHAQSIWSQMAGVPSPAHTDKLPDSLAKLYVGAGEMYDSATTQQIRASIEALVESGKYLGTYKMTYYVEASNGMAKKTLYLKPGDAVYKTNQGKFYVFNEFSPESSYVVLPSSKLSGYQWGSASPQEKLGDMSGYYGVEKIKEVPVKFDAELVNSKLDITVTDATVSQFNDSLKQSFGEAADKIFPNSGLSKGDALIGVKAQLESPAFQKDFPELAKLGVAHIPDGTLAFLLGTKDKNTDYAIANLAASYGYFNPEDKSSDPFAALGLQHDAPYADFLKKGDFSKESVFDLNMDHPVVFQKLATDLGVNHLLSDAMGQVSDKLTDAKTAGPSKPSSPQNDELQLTLIKGNHGLKGAHSKQMWADQHGNKWMTKAFENDPVYSDMRVGAENAANNIGRLYGFGSPESRLMVLPMSNGKKRLSYVQHLAPASGDVGYHRTWDELPMSAVQDIMQTHVLNWVISDHDGHGENFMLSPDGTHSFGIDHGQAGKFFGKDKLAVGYHATNPFPVWFDHVYNDMTAGLMPKDKVDAIRDNVLSKAAQMATRNEKQYLALMEEGVKHRTEYPAEFPTKEAWIEAHNARRKAAFDDFANFYKKLYQKAGYEWNNPTIDDYLPKKVGDAHAAVTPDFVADVKKSGSHGQALMFAGSEVRDSHMMTYTTQGQDGSTTLRMQTALLPGADTLFSAWLKKQTIEKVASAPVPQQSKEQQEKFAAAQLPDLSPAYSALEAYAKTVSTHAADGAYNSGTVSVAESKKKDLQAFYDEVKKQTDADPTKLVSYNGWEFKTAEQQDTWLAATATMLEQFDKVDNAKAQGVKPKELYPDDIPFEAPSYTPSPNLDNSGNPKVVAQFKYAGATYQKFGDGNYIKITGDKKEKTTAGDFAEAATGGEDTLPQEKPSGGDESGDTENVISVANKVIKVKYQQASSYSGNFTPGTNTVVEDSGSTKMTGHEYEIQHGDVVIRYQPRSGAGAVKAQQGLLRIEVHDWDGETGGLEDALAILRETGLSLEPATEESLELSYYRQLHAITKRRKGDAKLTKLRTEGDAITIGADDEIERWRKAFNSYYGAQTMQEFIDSKGFLPVLGGYAQGDNIGSPNFLRPDASVADYKEWSGGNLPLHTTTHIQSMTSDQADYSMAFSGFLSTEQRTRVLGSWHGGWSSEADQSHGSSLYGFFRQGSSAVKSEHYVYLEPEYAMSLSNYSLAGDECGNSKMKPTHSPFDLKGMAYHGANHNGAGSNELMVKNGVPVTAFAFQVVSASNRKKILEKYKELGIDSIGGVPVEEKFVTSDMVTQKLIDKVWERALEREKARKQKGKAA